MRDGRVVERGTHGGLLELRGGVYWSMVSFLFFFFFFFPLRSFRSEAGVVSSLTWREKEREKERES